MEGSHFIHSFIFYFNLYKGKEKQFNINTNVLWSRMKGTKKKKTNLIGSAPLSPEINVGKNII